MDATVMTRSELLELIKSDKGSTIRVYVHLFDAFVDVTKKETIFTLEKWRGPKCHTSFLVSKSADEWHSVIRVQFDYIGVHNT
jgi:hypothetical protein